VVAVAVVVSRLVGLAMAVAVARTQRKTRSP